MQHEPSVSPLLGRASSDDTCRPHDKKYLQKVMHYGRIIAPTNAFAQCIDQGMRNGFVGVNGNRVGPYMRCTGDSFFGESLDKQVAQVLAVIRSPNDVQMSCGWPAGRIAHADVRPYDHADPESLQWSTRLLETFDTLDYPDCNGATPSVTPCRWAPEPWPWSALADSIWHEAMHSHGYVHGDTEGREAEECGYTAAIFNYQVNTVPYIVGACVDEVAQRAARSCGMPIETAMPSGLAQPTLGLWLPDSFDNPSTCSWSTDNTSLWSQQSALLDSIFSQTADTDQYGDDYLQVDLAAHVDARACIDACSSDGHCQAYTYVPENVFGASPRCFLKNGPGEQRSAPGFVSGVRTTW